MTASWALRQIPRQGARGPHRRAQHDPAWQVVFIGSTAEGQEGLFFELGEAAGRRSGGVPLTPLDFKFHFFPWWKSPDYELDPAGVEITDANDRYVRSPRRSRRTCIGNTPQRPARPSKPR